MTHQPPDLDPGPRSGAADDEVDYPEADFQNRIGFLEVVDLVFTRATLSPAMQLFAGFFMALGFLAILAGAGPDLWVPFLITSVAFGTGILLLPFTWTTYLAVPELMDERVEADPSGMRIHVRDRIVEHPWTVYRSASETNRLFILRSRIVPTQIFTKRGIPAPQAASFREILREVGLLVDDFRTERRRGWAGFIAGTAIAVVLPLVFGLIAVVGGG